MSQAKVDKYKEYKKNRKEILAKEKKKKKIEKVVGWTALVVLVAALGTAVGVSIYNQHQAYLASLPNYTVSEKVIGDMTGILDEETEAAAGETEEAAQDETAGEAETEAQAE